MLCKIQGVKTSSEAAAILGSIKTPKKTASSRASIQKAHAGRRAQRKPISSIACTCGGGASLDRAQHVGTCPRYHALYYREKRGLPLE